MKEGFRHCPYCTAEVGDWRTRCPECGETLRRALATRLAGSSGDKEDFAARMAMLRDAVDRD